MDKEVSTLSVVSLSGDDDWLARGKPVLPGIEYERRVCSRPLSRQRGKKRKIRRGAEENAFQPEKRPLCFRGNLSY